MKRLSKPRLFLLELVLDLIVFCICAAICLAVFGRAHNLSQEADHLSYAVLLAERTAEAFYAANGELTQLEGTQADDQVSWDQDGYYVQVSLLREQASVRYAEIEVEYNGETVYTLPVTHYLEGVAA